jgi:hypothetical protein
MEGRKEGRDGDLRLTFSLPSPPSVRLALKRKKGKREREKWVSVCKSVPSAVASYLER